LLLGYPEIMENSAIPDIPKRRRGRPSTGGRREGVLVRLEPAQLKVLDDWAEDHEIRGLRPEAIRRLVEIGLQAKYDEVSEVARKKRLRRQRREKKQTDKIVRDLFAANQISQQDFGDYQERGIIPPHRWTTDCGMPLWSVAKGGKIPGVTG
jgi:hypothetical protein